MNLCQAIFGEFFQRYDVMETGDMDISTERWRALVALPLASKFALLL